MRDRLNRVEFVVQKYRLAEQVFVEAKLNGEALGWGRVMAEDTLQKFIDGDPSGNAKYLDWMLFQAGGGQTAMENALGRWNGWGTVIRNGCSMSDPKSLRNQCRAECIDERVRGYADELGVCHSPVSSAEAEDHWKKLESRSMFEFIMGDQDVVMSGSYGFYRHWPGKDGVYSKIVNAVKLWHMAQPKLLAQNQRYRRLTMLKMHPTCWYTNADATFMREYRETRPVGVELDLYAGWKPKEYSQKAARYKTLDDLLHSLAGERRMQVLRDIRFELIYEDFAVKVLCPLTIGASIKFGIDKWCISNRTEFDSTFGALECNWKRYNKTGPVVFLIWKRSMPVWLHRMAIHIDMAQPAWSVTKDTAHWVDCQNRQIAISYQEILHRIQDEHLGIPEPPARRGTEDDAYSYWGGREPGLAWKDAETGRDVIASLTEAFDAVKKWARTFQLNRIVLDYAADPLVDE